MNRKEKGWHHTPSLYKNNMKKQNKNNQLTLIVNLIRQSALLYVNRMIPSKKSLPKNIGGFYFDSTYKYTSFRHGYCYGVYKNKNGKMFFAKMWAGKFKDFEYQMMKNEETVLGTLKRPYNEVIKKHENLSYINLPNIILSKEDKNSFILLYDYIESDKQNHTAQQHNYYTDMISLFENIGNNLTENEKRKMQNRKPETIITTYILGCLKSIINHPSAATALLKNVPFFVININTLISEKNLKLSHRDLYINNIIKNKKNITIVDFALCVFTLKYYEQIAILINHWNEKNARQIYIEQLSQFTKKDKKSEKLYKLLSIAIATHHLTDSKLAKEKVTLYSDFLNNISNVGASNKYSKQSTIFSGIFALTESNIATHIQNSLIN